MPLTRLVKRYEPRLRATPRVRAVYEPRLRSRVQCRPLAACQAATYMNYTVQYIALSSFHEYQALVMIVDYCIVFLPYCMSVSYYVSQYIRLYTYYHAHKGLKPYVARLLIQVQ